MSTDKHLNISVKSNLREGQSLLKFLNDLSATGNKVAKALAGINLGGAGAGAQRGGLAKALLEQKSLFQDLGKAGENLARILSNQVGRSTEDLDKKLEKVNKSLARAIETHKKFEDKLANAKSLGERRSAESDVTREYGRIERLSNAATNIDEARSALRSGGGAGAGGILRALSQIPGLGLLAGGATAGYMGYRAYTTAFSAVRGWQENSAYIAGLPASLEAQRGSGYGQWDASIMMGDLKRRYYMDQAIGDPQGHAYAEAKGQRAATENNLFWQALAPGTGWDPRKWWANSQNQDTFRKVAYDNAQAEYAGKLQDAKPRENVGYDWLVANAAGLVRGSRRTGSSPLEFGTNREWTSAGFTNEEWQGAQTGLVNSAGRGALRLAGSVRWAAMHGMDLGTATSLAGAGAAGGDLLSALSGTGLDPRAQEVIGQAVASFLGPGNTIGSMNGLVQSLTSGIGGDSVQQLRMAGQNAQGMQSGQALFSGSNPWQKSVNLANAVAAIPGGSLYAQNKLANLDFPTLIGLLNDKSGKLPGQWTGLGVNRGAMEGYATKTFQSTLARFIDQGGNDESSKLARRIQGRFGGDIRAWARSGEFTEEKAEWLGGLLSQTDEGTFGSDTQATGAVRVMGGLGAGKTTGKGGAPSGPGDLPFDALTHQMQELNKVVTELLGPFGNLRDEVRRMVGIMSSTGAPYSPSNPVGSPFLGVLPGR